MRQSSHSTSINVGAGVSVTWQAPMFAKAESAPMNQSTGHWAGGIGRAGYEAGPMDRAISPLPQPPLSGYRSGMPYPDRFYPVVDSVAWVRRLAQLGVGTIQLRAKDLPHAEAVKIVHDALAAAGNAKLVVNDHWKAAIECGAKHVHLGYEDSAAADFVAIRRAGLTLGLSTHDEAELETALGRKPDYIALGPIYPTTLKLMRFAPQGLARVTQWKKRIGVVPLVAIGGIKLEQAAAIYAAGADSIAVVSDITQNRDPDARVRAWLADAAQAA